VLRSGSDDGKANAAGALGNLGSGGDAIRAAVVESGAIPLLFNLLRGGSDEGKANAAGTLEILNNF
jgi:hypothetical protein